MVNQIEFLDLESKVFEGLKAGNQVLEQISKQMSVEDVEQLMDDTKDQIDNVNVLLFVYLCVFLFIIGLLYCRFLVFVVIIN